MLSLFNKNKELYVISYLNKHSIILAKSITEHNTEAVVLFTQHKDMNRNYVSDAKKAGFTVSSNSLEGLKLEQHNQRKMVYIILMNPDENINLHDALSLVRRLRDKINAEIYSFNSSVESECLFDSIYKGQTHGDIRPIKLRRVNAVRNQIYLDLLNNSLFENAVTEYNEKIISVLIVGLGTYGMEMLKGIIWCSQMDGYILRAHIIDKNPDIESVFYHHCPGIKQRGSQPRNGEDYYELYFYGGIDVDTAQFDDCVKSLPETSFVFVSLGDEDNNLKVSLNLRLLFSGMNIDYGKVPEHEYSKKQVPRILTVIYSTDIAELTKNNRLANYKNQYYQIDSIGTDTDVYSYENIFYPKLEKMALISHLQWGSEEDFDSFEYNRRSSMASSIHKKYRDLLIPDDETKNILEHKRWNAYMRSTEGYSFGYIRDDLARRHPSLVKYDNLSCADKDKDFRMNFKSEH